MSDRIIIFDKEKYKKKYNNLNKIINNKFEIIPRQIYTHWHTKNLPPLMSANLDKLKSDNPEFTVTLFDNQDCINFINTHFPINVINAYNNIIPEAYKSDLWRYCVLYINGGIYVDIKYECINNFRFITLCNNEYFVLDRPNFFENYFGIYNALLISSPKSNFLLEVIQRIADNSKNHFYGYNVLHPTGPALLGEHFEKYYHNYNFELCNHETCNFIIYKNTQILKVYNKYREEQNETKKTERYTVLWNKRNIYIDEIKPKKMLIIRN
jgi:mannosyltransferase OCH1-like enzyme